MDAAALRAMRDTLSLVPIEWALWAMDADGVFLVHEGPGVYRKGLRPGECVGRSVAEVHKNDPRPLAYIQSAMQRPTTDHLVFNGYTFLVSGTPMAGGGCVGLALVVGPATEHEPVCAVPAVPVLELARSVPEVGGMEGDLLVIDPEEHDLVGLYRTISRSSLPQDIANEIHRITAPSGVSGTGSAPSAGASGSRRERATHLRLLP